MGEGRGFYRVSVGRPGPLGRPRRRWEDNIKLDLREIGIDGANWIQLAKVADSCEHGNKPSGLMRGGQLLDELVDHHFLKNSVCFAV
jgi:hypothetical protein